MITISQVLVDDLVLLLRLRVLFGLDLDAITRVQIELRERHGLNVRESSFDEALDQVDVSAFLELLEVDFEELVLQNLVN